MTRAVPSGKAQLQRTAKGAEPEELNHEAMAVCRNSGLVHHQLPTRCRIANNLSWRLRVSIEGREICLCAADACDSAAGAHPCRHQRTNIGQSGPWDAVQGAGWSNVCQWRLVVAHSKSPIPGDGLDSRR